MGRLLACLLALSFATPRAGAMPGGPSELLFTRHDGLAGAGRVVAAWADKARLHGLDLLPDPAVAAYVADLAAGKAHSPLAQAAVERSLSATLERLVAELPAAPRVAPVLSDAETGFYRSPDVTWRGVTRSASPDAVSAAREAALAGTLDAHLTALLPRHPQYARLVAAAEHYASICAAGGWQPIARPRLPKRGPYRPTPEVVRAYRARLAAEGYYRPGPDDGAEASWDEATDAALATFRRTHQVPAKGKGISEDDLLAALNVPCEARLATLILNVRRWRFSGWRGEPTRVEVNVAGQELRYLRDDALVMAQRTIVGSPKWYFDHDLQRRINLHATPVLSDHIARVVVNPLWAVPPRIAKNEIDVEVAKDPTYLDKHNMQLVTSERGRTYIQAPGFGNALGVIKVLFPNDEDVYLHDTPKKGAFDLAVRALSHGCVRVQNAVDFGLAILAHDAERAGRPFDEAALRERLGRTGPLVFDLSEEIPVFLEYYTASVGDDGLVRFHPDIYAYDAEVTSELARVP